MMYNVFLVMHTVVLTEQYPGVSLIDWLIDELLEVPLVAEEQFFWFRLWGVELHEHLEVFRHCDAPLNASDAWMMFDEEPDVQRSAPEQARSPSRLKHLLLWDLKLWTLRKWSQIKPKVSGMKPTKTTGDQYKKLIE